MTQTRLGFGLVSSIAFVATVALAACGPNGHGNSPDGGGNPGGPDGGPGTPGTLRVEPANASVSAEPGLPGELDYSAIYTDDGGQDVDVTGEATFSVENTTFGTMNGNHFTSATDRAGTTHIIAMARGKTAQTSVTVRLRTIVIGPGADASAPGKFGGTIDPSRAPELVYPSDQTLVPPNLNVLEFQFMPGTGNTLFKLTYQGAVLQLEIYFACQTLGAGCAFTPDETTWDLIATAEKGQAPGTWTVSGVDGASPNTVGVSAGRVLGFGQDDIVGGLYYWNAGAGKIMRYDFGLRTAQAENYLTSVQAGGLTCVGCHSLSRDGKKIAAGLDIPGGTFKVFDVGTRAMIFEKQAFGLGGDSFFSFNPDGTEMMASDGFKISWLHADTGASINDTLVNGATMPDWSPDGMSLVYAKGAGGPTGCQNASIEIMAYNGATWMPGTTLVPYANQNNFYPSFAPSGDWVLFNRSPSNHDSYDAPDAQVWAVPTSGGAPVQLAMASTGVNGDSWPKWAPDVQPYRGGTLMWFTFSSRRAIGLRGASGTAQIWMAAFDPSKAQAGQDPSWSGFWLPFQEPSSGNHIAQWVTEVHRQDCTDDMQCQQGEFCQGGQCVPVVQ